MVWEKGVWKTHSVSGKISPLYNEEYRLDEFICRGSDSSDYWKLSTPLENNISKNTFHLFCTTASHCSLFFSSSVSCGASATLENEFYFHIL